MRLTKERGYKIREEYSEVKEKLVCNRHNLCQVGGSRTKIDGAHSINNLNSGKSIKNASGSSTQVHLTTQNHFINGVEWIGMNSDVVKFIQLFCGNKDMNNNGNDRYSIKQIDPRYTNAFNVFLSNNKKKIVDLVVRNNNDVTHVVFNDIKSNVEYELSYNQIMGKISKCEWKFMSGGIHLKDSDGKTYFHLQREGKKNPKNRYNVLFHIHKNLFK